MQTRRHMMLNATSSTTEAYTWSLDMSCNVHSALRNEMPPPAVDETLNMDATMEGHVKLSPCRNVSDCHMPNAAFMMASTGFPPSA
jgi:hypothetical protein